jgi:colicin import membrane protein
MKLIALILCLSALTAAAQDVEAQLKAQRSELTVAHVATMAAVHAECAVAVKAAASREAEAKAAQAKAEAALKAAETKLQALIGAAKQAAQKKTAAERNAAMSAAVTDIEKTENQKRREAIATEKTKLEAEAAALAE